MSEHRVTVAWQRSSEGFAYPEYNREHEWRFASGRTVQASAAPKYLGNGENVDPEEAFVAAVSACHMLTFLAICARRCATGVFCFANDYGSCSRMMRKTD
jgi:organic hydroperoxide reductase OsmC/OhrA